jgi:release factor glutamine methyltransferase
MFRNEIFRFRAISLQRVLNLSDREAREEIVALFAKASNVTKLEMLTDPEHLSDGLNVERFELMFQRRLTGEPIEYITGESYFYGLTFFVNSSVLIPRIDTETILNALIDRSRNSTKKDLLELGVGSGIVSIAALKCIAGLTVVATDISCEAINVARKNVDRILKSTEKIRFLLGDWFEPVSGRFDFIVSNPPYISEGDIHLEDISMSFEPKIALTSGPDGFRDLSLIIEKSPEYLNSGGWLILEHGFDQSSRVTAAMRKAGFEEIFTDCDLGGRPRVSGGRMPSRGILDT